jgi:hypothetical protein
VSDAGIDMSKPCSAVRGWYLLEKAKL